MVDVAHMVQDQYHMKNIVQNVGSRESTLTCVTVQFDSVPEMVAVQYILSYLHVCVLP